METLNYFGTLLDSGAELFTDGVLNPGIDAASAFWDDVLAPFGSSAASWCGERLGWLSTAAGGVQSFFKLRLAIRSYTFTLIAPIVVAVLVFTLIRRKKTKKGGKA